MDAEQLTPPAPTPARRGGPRRRLLVAGGAGLAIVVALAVWVSGLGSDAETPPDEDAAESAGVVDAAAAEAQALAGDPRAVELLRIPLDGSFGNYVSLPASSYLPQFPAKGPVDWVSALGEYHGWDVWIGSARAVSGVVQREHCILIERGAASRSRCVPAALREDAALLVSVPYALVAPDERPAAMLEGHRLAFWWGDGGSVAVLLADPEAVPASD
ncbi:hypothetical protein [Microbacterium sp. 2FI]|uniref:hypothetical protein n=1 Tax=Microbacterium sp. 2FI TaxID=2502193 RepID=UPI0010F704C3|nr:hypothetical protein [Microbacterium sp. 2FI]